MVVFVVRIDRAQRHDDQNSNNGYREVLPERAWTLKHDFRQGGKYVVQNRKTKAINKLCVPEILSLSFVCGACFFEFRGRNLVCFGIAYKFHACALRFSRVRAKTGGYPRISPNFQTVRVA